MRVQKVFTCGDKAAQFIGLTTPKAGRVRLRFFVYDDETQDCECFATNQSWPDGTKFAQEFLATFGKTPHAMRNAGFVCKLGMNGERNTVLCFQPDPSFTVPMWARAWHDAWQSDPDTKQKYLAAREATDEKFRIAQRIRKATWESIILGIDHCSLLGLDSEGVRRHIEKQFEPGWSWKSYPEVFEIDHIQPLSRFDLTNIIEVRKAAHYTNLRPLLVTENRAKYNEPLEQGKEAA